tara:strand:+ start:58 stop:1824 length:1767 start_codon:yes stop_codon:yes gene_type:complete
MYVSKVLATIALRESIEPEFLPGLYRFRVRLHSLTPHIFLAMKRPFFSLLTLTNIAISSVIPLPAIAQDDSLSLLWTQYSLAENTLKLTAHTDLDPMDPLAATATLELKSGNSWQIVASSEIEPLTAMAAFKINNWDSDTDHVYRVVCGSTLIAGVIRAEPDDKRVLKLMAVSCVNDNRFPYRKAVRQMIDQDPDLLFFAGDQLYQTNAGGETIQAHDEKDVLPALANYLPKWRKFGLTFRDLLKDRPSIILTDDHDVYLADLWGAGGKRMKTKHERGFNPSAPYNFGNPEERTPMLVYREGGGYLHPKWTNSVERMQMGHLPDAAQPGPWGSGIMAYFTSLDYGGVSFAVLEDRKFKSPPTDVLSEPVDDPSSDKPNTTLEVIMDPAFDTDSLDQPGLDLLGEVQEKFVRQWTDKVERSGKLAAVLHQSPLVNVGNYKPYYGDLDSNGWPQTPRGDALRAIAPSQAVMISGDLHYATILQQGIDDWGDGPWTYSLPAFGSNQGRIWDPKRSPQGGAIPGRDGTGNYHDRFGNKLTLDAKADGIVGYGTILFDKEAREITLEIHPMDPDTRDPIDIKVVGWPKVIKVE